MTMGEELLEKYRQRMTDTHREAQWAHVFEMKIQEFMRQEFERLAPEVHLDFNTERNQFVLSVAITPHCMQDQDRVSDVIELHLAVAAISERELELEIPAAENLSIKINQLLPLGGHIFNLALERIETFHHCKVANAEDLSPLMMG